MKKFIFILALFSALSAVGQNTSIRAEVYKDIHVTTSQRDEYVVPAGQTWHIYNSTTGRNEKNVGGSGWVEDGGITLSDSDIKDAYERNADTNAFTDAEKSKLVGIATGAEVNVQSDWDAGSGDAAILNKPTLGDLAAKDDISASDIVGGGTNGQVLTTDGSGTVTWGDLPNSGATQLSDLTDVNSSTPTNRNVLIADGTDWESRALTFADIPNLQNELDLKANDDEVVKEAALSQIKGLSIAVGSKTYNDGVSWPAGTIVIDTLEGPGGTDYYATGISVSGTTSKTLTMTRSGGLPNLTATWTDESGGGGGGGDMLRSTYDINTNNIVDDSEKLNNQSAAYYLARANHTGTQLSGTISDFQTAVSSNSAVAANTAKVGLTNLSVTTARLADNSVTTGKIVDGTIVNADIGASANISATKIGTGAIDNTEFNYLNGVTSGIQSQLNGKANSSHFHNAADINAGVILLDRIPIITNGHIGVDAISIVNMRDNSVGSNEIINGSVRREKMSIQGTEAYRKLLSVTSSGGELVWIDLKDAQLVTNFTPVLMGLTNPGSSLEWAQGTFVRSGNIGHLAINIRINSNASFNNPGDSPQITGIPSFSTITTQFLKGIYILTGAGVVGNAHFSMNSPGILSIWSGTVDVNSKLVPSSGFFNDIEINQSFIISP